MALGKATDNENVNQNSKNSDDEKGRKDLCPGPDRNLTNSFYGLIKLRGNTERQRCFKAISMSS